MKYVIFVFCLLVILAICFVGGKKSEKEEKTVFVKEIVYAENRI